MQNRFKLISVLIVPILGLTSCSKDKDDWQMAEPVVVDTVNEARSISMSSGSVWEADAQIRFPAQDWRTLNVDYRCEFLKEVFVGSLVLPVQSSINLRSLWPENLLKTKTADELENTRCSFSLTAVNDSGSTHSFSLANINVRKFDNVDFTNVSLKSNLAQNADLLHSEDLSTAILALTSNFSDDAKIKMICGDQSSEIGIKAASRTPNLAVALAFSMALKGRKLCHFVTYEPDREGTLPKIELTRQIEIKFPLVPLKVETTTELAHVIGLLGHGLANEPMVQISITNIGQEKTFVVIPPRTTLSLRGIYMVSKNTDDHALGESSGMWSLDAYAVVTDALETSTGEHGVVLPIEPGQKRQFTLRLLDIPEYYSCGTFGTPAGYGLAGLRFDFKDAFTISQFQKSEAEDLDIGVEMTPSSNGLQFSFLAHQATWYYGSQLGTASVPIIPSNPAATRCL